MPALSKPTRNWASSIIIWLKIIPRSLWIWLQAEPVGIICLIIGNECYKGIVLFLKCNNLRMFRPYNVRLEFELLGTCLVYSHPANQVSLSQTWQSFFGMRHWPLSSPLAGRPYYRQRGAQSLFSSNFSKNFFPKMYCHFSIFLDPLNPNLASIFIIFRFETSIPRYIDIYQVQNYKVFGAIL